MMKTMIKNFAAPGAEFRGAPFWAWNSGLDRDELLRQVHIFKAMGMGGFFMHSRVGLNTPYLGKDWFDCVRSCIAEAEKLGMRAYLYDEDRWPSGSAGGIVTADDRYKSRWCAVEIYSGGRQAQKAAEGETLCWYSAVVSGSFEQNTLRIKSPRRLTSPADFKPGRNRKLLRFALQLMDNHEWYNGGTYLDTLNPEAVQKFIDVTHEAYFRECGAEFGKTVPAIFSDEPMFFSPRSLSTVIIPWTEMLPEKFQAEYHADILEHLPEICFTSVCKKSVWRLRYLNLITRMFCQAFAGTISDWCSKHGLQMTGHVMSEDRLNQAMIVGAAMRFYEYMQFPGIDVLTECWRVFNTAKQCSSVAHQFGRRQRLSETYGCTGWDFPFAGHKAVGDWQYALGINFRCQHLAWYSAESEAKRDYPASISYQSPWYEKYPVVEDYFARLGAVMSEGEELCELLVIHPIESAWMAVDPAWLGKHCFVKENRRFAKLTDTLLAQKLDFDFGDEEIIARHGRVEAGKIAVRCAAYRAVLIPELETIRGTTLELLREFAEQGGTVVYLNSAPQYQDGERSNIPEQIFTGFIRATLAEAVKLLGGSIRRVGVTDRAGRQIAPVLARLADTGSAYTLFLCNYGAKFNADTILNDCPVRERKLKYPYARITLTVPQRGDVYELHPLDGSISRVEYSYKDGQYCFESAFGELESHLFLITAENPGTVADKKSASFRKAVKLPAENWDYQLDDPNVLILDHADGVADGEVIGKNCYILELDNTLRRMLGVMPRGRTMCQPWTKLHQEVEKKLDLTLTYSFTVANVPETDCLLALEHPEFYRIKLNGQILDTTVKRWWFDRSCQCIAIPAELLLAGSNTLELYSEYHENLPGLEAMFLLGDFGVTADAVTALPRKLTTGDWCTQGLPYYAGNVTYSREVEIPDGGAVLEFADWSGVLLGVRIADGAETLLPWPPYRLELPAGKFRLYITVYGSRRNALGPFFVERQAWVGPDQFRMKQQNKRQLIPGGLLGEPVIKIIK